MWERKSPAGQLLGRKAGELGQGKVQDQEEASKPGMPD